MKKVTGLELTEGKNKDNDDFLLWRPVFHRCGVGILGDFTGGGPTGIGQELTLALSRHLAACLQAWRDLLVEPEKMVHLLANFTNKWLHERQTSARTTLVVMAYDAEERVLHHLSVGDSGLVLVGDRGVRFLHLGDTSGTRDASGFLPLPELSVKAQQTPMHPGDVAVAFSDGLWENCHFLDPDRDPEGCKAYFADVFASRDRLKLEERIRAKIFNRAQKYDDMTVLALFEETQAVDTSPDPVVPANRLELMVERKVAEIVKRHPLLASAQEPTPLERNLLSFLESTGGGLAKLGEELKTQFEQAHRKQMSDLSDEWATYKKGLDAFQRTVNERISELALKIAPVQDTLSRLDDQVDSHDKWLVENNDRIDLLENLRKSLDEGRLNDLVNRRVTVALQKALKAKKYGTLQEDFAGMAEEPEAAQTVDTGWVAGQFETPTGKKPKKGAKTVKTARILPEHGKLQQWWLWLKSKFTREGSEKEGAAGSGAKTSLRQNLRGQIVPALIVLLLGIVAIFIVRPDWLGSLGRSLFSTPPVEKEKLLENQPNPGPGSDPPAKVETDVGKPDSPDERVVETRRGPSDYQLALAELSDPNLKAEMLELEKALPNLSATPAFFRTLGLDPDAFTDQLKCMALTLIQNRGDINEKERTELVSQCTIGNGRSLTLDRSSFAAWARTPLQNQEKKIATAWLQVYLGGTKKPVDGSWGPGTDRLVQSFLKNTLLPGYSFWQGLAETDPVPSDPLTAPIIEEISRGLQRNQKDYLAALVSSAQTLINLEGEQAPVAIGADGEIRAVLQKGGNPTPLGKWVAEYRAAPAESRKPGMPLFYFWLSKTAGLASSDGSFATIDAHLEKIIADRGLDAPFEAVKELWK